MKPTPKAWVCKHCGERCDPTTCLCWNCGHDRAGQYDPSWYREVGVGALEACPNCEYSLIGSTDKTECPECGMVLPEPGFKPINAKDAQGSSLLRVLRGPLGWMLAALLAFLYLIQAI